MTDIQQQLSALVGQHVKQLRITDETPPHVSVIDVVSAITGHNGSNAALTFGRLKSEHPEVTTNCSDFRFPGQGQRKTPCTSIRGMVELIFLLPGHHAARVRRQAAELLVRYLGGDLQIIPEVCHNRGIQEELVARAPEDPRRVFGGVVEAAGAPSGEQQMVRMCSEIVSRALPEVLHKLTTHIDERFAHLESRQRVNLNVRAPQKKALLHDPPIVSDIASRSATSSF